MKKINKLLVLFIILLLTPQATLSAAGTVRLLFFYSEGCHSCRELKAELLPLLQQKYGRNLEIKELAIGSIPNFELLLKLERQTGRKINKTPPLIVIGNDILEGSATIREHMDQTISKYFRQGGVNFPDAGFSETPETKSSVSDEFSKISLAALIAGALVDGVNPCAFTTLVFLISYLAFIGRKGKQLLISGFLFSLGVFAAYFLAGIGVMEILKQLEAFPIIAKTLSWLLFGTALLFGLLNLYDYLVLKSGKNDRLKLGLTDYLKQKIHAVIRAEKQTTGYLSGCFLGAVVGMLELPCTGQVYFPIIMMVREMNPDRIKAIGYLLLYNLIFILPLIAVFSGTYFGLSTGIITKFIRNHLAKVKLLTALFFFGLALLLVWV